MVISTPVTELSSKTKSKVQKTRESAIEKGKPLLSRLSPFVRIYPESDSKSSEPLARVGPITTSGTIARGGKDQKGILG